MTMRGDTFYATFLAQTGSSTSFTSALAFPQQYPEANTDHTDSQQSLDVRYVSDPNSIRDSDETNRKEISDG
jgi:hypothetical protein